MGGLAVEDEPLPEDDFDSGLAGREANILDDASDEETDTAALLAFSVALLFLRPEVSLPASTCVTTVKNGYGGLTSAMARIFSRKSA